MGEKDRILVGIPVLACAILLICTIFLFTRGQTYKKENASLSGNVRELELSRDMLEKTLEETGEAKKAAEERLRNSEDSMKRLFSQLKEEKARSEKLLAESGKERDRLSAEVKRYQRETRMLRDNLRLADTKYADAKQKLDNSERLRREAEEEIKKLKPSAENMPKREATSLGTVVVR